MLFNHFKEFFQFFGVLGGRRETVPQTNNTAHVKCAHSRAFQIGLCKSVNLGVLADITIKASVNHLSLCTVQKKLRANHAQLSLTGFPPFHSFIAG